MANFLPLTNNPEESFSLTIDDILYNFKQLWNADGEFWTLDILDSDGVALVYGVKIVTQWNLLEQYPAIPFELRASNDNDPTRNNLAAFLVEVTIKDV